MGGGIDAWVFHFNWNTLQATFAPIDTNELDTTLLFSEIVGAKKVTNQVAKSQNRVGMIWFVLENLPPCF